jgi:hypothetical protein
MRVRRLSREGNDIRAKARSILTTESVVAQGVVMERRGFLISLTGAILGARAALAQQVSDKPRRIGALMPFLEQDADGRSRFAAFLEQMHQLGWTEGRNLRIDVRWTGPDPDRIRIAAKELLELQPELIVTDGSVPVVELARETRTLPIVFAAVADRSASELRPASLTPAAISAGSLTRISRSAANGCKSSRRLHPILCASACSSIRQRRSMQSAICSQSRRLHHR